MIGVVTLYNPETEQVATNINLFLPFIDKLIIWDNSYKDKSVRKRMESLLQNEEEKVLYLLLELVKERNPFMFSVS